MFAVKPEEMHLILRDPYGGRKPTFSNCPLTSPQPHIEPPHTHTIKSYMGATLLSAIYSAGVVKTLDLMQIHAQKKENHRNIYSKTLCTVYNFLRHHLVP